MVQVSEAIYRNGNLKLLEKLHLHDGDRVKVRVESVDGPATQEDQPTTPTTAIDPLHGLRISTGIPDLAEHFDDYRFGRRKP